MLFVTISLKFQIWNDTLFGFIQPRNKRALEMKWIKVFFSREGESLTFKSIYLTVMANSQVLKCLNI